MKKSFDFLMLNFILNQLNLVIFLKITIFWAKKIIIVTKKGEDFLPNIFVYTKKKFFQI